MAKKDSRIIVAGPGEAALPAAGHKRRETLKKRTDKLSTIADGLMNNTDAAIYSVNPDALKEEPEILKHLNFADHTFDVTNPVRGKVYFWCFDRPQPIAQKRTEAKMWLGPQAAGWEIVGACSCAPGSKHLPKDCVFPEAREVIAADGRRVIGDVFLMRMDLAEYTRMHKRMMLVQRYRESNVPEPLADFMQRHEGLVQVVSGNETPEQLYRRVQANGQMRHNKRIVLASDYDNLETE